MNNVKTVDHDESAIRTLHEDVVSAFNANNLERILSLHTEDVILIDPTVACLMTGNSEI